MFKFSTKIAKILSFVLLLVPAAPVHAANVTFSGTIYSVDVDTGTGIYSGAAAGDTFIMNVVYGDSEGQATGIYVETNEKDWRFTGSPFSGNITNGVTPSSGTNAGVNIQNDDSLNDYQAGLVSTLLGTTVPTGTTVDTWSVDSHTDNAYWDVNDNLVNGLSFSSGFLALGGNLHADLTYQPVPPKLVDVDLGFFIIEEADTQGNTLFSAIGIIDTVPVPGAVWLLGSGLIGLIGIRRKFGKP